jgi:hypothetical protein
MKLIGLGVILLPLRIVILLRRWCVQGVETLLEEVVVRDDVDGVEIQMQKGGK